MIKKILILFLIVSLIGNVSAIDLDNQYRLSFGHILLVRNITTDPVSLIPGNPGILKINIYNEGKESAADIRSKLILPSDISFLNDVSEKRIIELKPGEESTIEFNIAPLPKAAEGIYKAQLLVNYVNFVGEEREDNYSIGIAVKSSPKIFAHIEKTDVYNEKKTGDITVDFTNNDLADIKFLTLEVGDSKDFEMISSNKIYIGDLDSGDFQSEIFTIKVNNNVKEISIPVTLTYKDSLNKDYTEQIQIPMKLRSAKELGISTTNYFFVILIIIVLVALGVYFYKKRKNKKKGE